MLWTRSETLGLASMECALCDGVGLPSVHDTTFVPCSCVGRKIFRICMDKFRNIAEKEKSLTHVSLDAYGQGNTRGYVWGRKDEEFMADFFLIAKRTLTVAEYRMFSFRYLLGADSRLCCRRLGMDRSTFFRHLYKIEEKLGLAFRETEPYPLFPLDEYFNGTAKKLPSCAIRYTIREDKRPKHGPLRPPIAA